MRISQVFNINVINQVISYRPSSALGQYSQVGLVSRPIQNYLINENLVNQLLKHLALLSQEKIGQFRNNNNNNNNKKKQTKNKQKKKNNNKKQKNRPIQKKSRPIRPVLVELSVLAEFVISMLWADFAIQILY